MPGKILSLLLVCVLAAGCKKPSVIVLKSGGDFGQKLTDAMNACAPSVACYIDGKNVTGAQSSAQNIIISRPLTTIDVAFSSLTMAAGMSIQISGNYTVLEGPSINTSAIRCQSGNNPCLYIGTSNGSSGVYGVTVRDLAIIPVEGTYSTAGIEIENARGPGAMLDRLNVDGFISGTALRFLENSWTWNVQDSTFADSNRGMEILGDQPNALVFSHDLFNTNANEGVYMKLCDHPSSYGGCTSNGLFFCCGNHFEGNGTTGIRLVNGSFYNIDLRDSYAELTKSNTGYFLAQNDGTVNGQLRVSGMLVDGGGGYVAGDVAINAVDATKGYNYGVAPVPIRSITCADGNCQVVTQTPHGLTCSMVNGYSLCPYAHLKGQDEATFRITSVEGPRQFSFFLNGIRSGNSGTVEYAPDLISATITNEKWDSSWTAPLILSAAGSGAMVTTRDNSVLDGLGNLVGDDALGGSRTRPRASGGEQ